MKRILIPLLMLMFFSTALFSQIAVENKSGSDSYTISLTYDIDSAATLTTGQFSFDDFDGTIDATHPITVYHDQATDGAPATTANIEIILWGVYNGSTYTYPMDTSQVHAVAQGVDDTLSTLTMNGWTAPVYYITINNTAGNASGVTVFHFPMREHGRVSELDKSH